MALENPPCPRGSVWSIASRGRASLLPRENNPKGGVFSPPFDQDARTPGEGPGWHESAMAGVILGQGRFPSEEAKST